MCWSAFYESQSLKLDTRERLIHRIYCNYWRHGWKLCDFFFYMEKLFFGSDPDKPQHLPKIRSGVYKPNHFHKILTLVRRWLDPGQCSLSQVAVNSYLIGQISDKSVRMTPPLVLFIHEAAHGNYASSNALSDEHNRTTLDYFTLTKRNRLRIDFCIFIPWSCTIKGLFLFYFDCISRVILPRNFCFGCNFLRMQEH